MSKGNVIGIFSGKGGVGKTTLVSNLGAALSNDYNKKVLVVDSNVKTSHLGLHFGLYEEMPLTLKEVIENKVPVFQAIFVHPPTGLRLLPAPLRGDMELNKLSDIVNKVRGTYNPIIVDCAPGLGKDVVMAAKAIDKALIVTTPDIPALTDAIKTINLLEKLKKKIEGIVVNRVRRANYEITKEEVESMCEYNVIATIPESTKIPESISKGMPVVLCNNSNASESFKKLAAILINQEYHTPRGLLYKLKNALRFGSRVERNSFVRETEMKKSRKKDLIAEKKAIEKVKEGLKKDIRKDGHKKNKDSGLERVILAAVEEKLRQKVGK